MAGHQMELLREQVLRELGSRDIFKKVKDEENAKAISLFEDVARMNDGIDDEGKRVENLVRGILAGNIFDLGSAQLAEIFAKDGMSFLASCQNLLSRPWVIDDLDTLKIKWLKKSWKKKVVLAANELPSINDVTYLELLEIISKLKDEKGQLAGVDISGLLVANSGNDLPGRAIETNLYAQMKCDSVKVGMVKHPEVAQFSGGRLYDCVFKYNEVVN